MNREIPVWIDKNRKLYLDECPFKKNISEDRICDSDYEEFERKMVEKYTLNGRTEIRVYCIGNLKTFEKRELSIRMERLRGVLNQN